MIRNNFYMIYINDVWALLSIAHYSKSLAAAPF